MQGPNRLRVGSIEHLAAIAAYADEANVSQDPEVLRNGGLRQAQAGRNVPDRTLPQREIAQYFAPPGLGNRVEGIRSRSCAWHECNITFPYRNMSSGFEELRPQHLAEVGK